MVEIGRFNHLTVVKRKDFGFYLDGEELGELLLPKKYAPEDLQIDDDIEVFVCLDSEDRPIATTQQPKVQVGEFALLQVAQTSRIGAFLNWGLDKDLLAPFAEQQRPMEDDKRYLVYVYLDDIDQRPTASSKIDRFLKDENEGKFKSGQQVDLIIGPKTDLGVKAIVDNSHWGLIFNDQLTEKVYFGQQMKGYIQQVRKDGRLNISLQQGKQVRDKNAQIVLDFLQKQGGFAAVHDKSDPQLIKRLLGLSKGAFKKAIGGLYKNGQIVIEENGIKLAE